MKRRGVFLDRDGVVNELVHYPSHGEWESPRSIGDVRLIAGVPDAIAEFNRSGWVVFVITNQPSFAKGKCSLESLQKVHEEILVRLRAAGAVVTDSYVCYHHPQSVLPGFGSCDCRKPSPRFLLIAAEKYDIDLARSWMVGDQDTDTLTGKAAGCRTALVEYEHSQAKRGGADPDLVSASLAELIGKLD